MALNNFMHPRNIYKIPPDFGKLAQTYPEFSNICKMDLSGQLTINFKDPHCLRVLTKCLLKTDFNLEVEIPEDRLVPTLPLRLNYIHWLEDLLKLIGRENNIWGIDIGTGACAIYPILAATMNKWFMIGTEVDDESLQKAHQNIQNNNLSEHIKLSKNSTQSLIQYVLDNQEGQQFDFCMCNPPFYSNFQELSESRNPSRPLPKNGFTGSPQELITEGGELEFCRKLINESKLYKDRVVIFTTMVGHKYNLMELLQDLSVENIKYTHTEFCQGRVTRWGLAWTYQNHDIYKLVPPRNKLRKKTTPIAYQLSQLSNIAYDVNTCTEKIIAILKNIAIDTKIVNKRTNTMSLHINAYNNTWSHQRRKRRQMKRMQEQDAKKIKLDSQCPNKSDQADLLDEDTSNTNVCNNNEEDKPGNKIVSGCKEPILQAFLKVFRKDNVVLLEIEFLSGCAGKEGLHQLVQYIKNNWKYTCFLLGKES